MKKSFVSRILIYLVGLTILLFAILGIFLLSSYLILTQEIKESSHAFLRIYSNEFVNTVEEMDRVLKNIATQGEDLAKIKSGDENEQGLSSIALFYYLKTQMEEKKVADFLVIYDANHDITLNAISNGLPMKTQEQLNAFTKKAVGNESFHSFVWDFTKIGETEYFYKLILTNDRAIGIYVRTKKLLGALAAEDNGNRSIFLTNREGYIGKVWGSETKDIFEGASIKTIKDDNYYKMKKEVVKENIVLHCYTSKTSVFHQMSASMLVVAVTIVVAVSFILFILGYTRGQIAAPMQMVVKDMEAIRNGDYNRRVTGSFHTSEFWMLKETTNQMLEEILGLKIQTYERKIALQDMELKSIRLQLKPHFFLNALTTISSLSSQNKNAQIKKYVEALSKNVRYMFRAGLHTVSLKEEIRHVENYFEMQDLKYPGCVFYLIDMPKEVEEWRVPQLLIHTFIENEYKYAVSMEHTLTILIKLSKTDYKGEEVLKIELEDDGKGYPEQILTDINEGRDPSEEEGNRIGLFSIKRMLEIMYDRGDLLWLENVSPHGCLNRIYLPGEPKHELVKRK